MGRLHIVQNTCTDSSTKTHEHAMKCSDIRIYVFCFMHFRKNAPSQVQFNLQLSEKERIDRAKVVLPFEHQGMMHLGYVLFLFLQLKFRLL